MNDKTENLENAFSYIRTFYNEVAKMLSDVIKLMDDDGWKTNEGGSITADLSYSLMSPNQWMSQYIYKNFTKENETKGIYIFFSKEANNFPISIVCGKSNSSIESDDKWWLYYLAFNNKDALEGLGGEVCSLKTEYNKREITGDLFAISLSRVRSQEDLKEEVVKKLLAL